MGGADGAHGEEGGVVFVSTMACPQVLEWIKAVGFESFATSEKPLASDPNDTASQQPRAALLRCVQQILDRLKATGALRVDL